MAPPWLRRARGSRAYVTCEFRVPVPIGTVSRLRRYVRVGCPPTTNYRSAWAQRMESAFVNCCNVIYLYALQLLVVVLQLHELC